MVIKVKNQFEIDSQTMGGMDDRGQLYCRCLTCNKSMIFKGMKRERGQLLNIYICPLCKKVKMIKRMW